MSPAPWLQWGCLRTLLIGWEEAAWKQEGLGGFPAAVVTDRGTKRSGLVVVQVCMLVLLRRRTDVNGGLSGCQALG